MKATNKLVSLALLGTLVLGVVGCKGKAEKRYLIPRAHSPTVEVKSAVMVNSPARDEGAKFNHPDYMIVNGSEMKKLGLDPSKHVEYTEN